MNASAHHLQLDANTINGARIALLPGDPGRVPAIADHLENSSEIANAREFRSFLGESGSEPVLVTSTGCGGPSLSVCVEELARLGVRVFIRVGSTGSIQDHVNVGDVVISNAAVRLDGASRSFAPLAFPAVSHFEVTSALVSSARRQEIDFHVGVTASTDTFYQGQERYDTYSGFVPEHLRGSLKEWQSMHVLNFEMEAATLFTMCASMDLMAGTVCGVVAKRTEGELIVDEQLFKRAERNSIKVAVGSVTDCLDKLATGALARKMQEKRV